MKLYTVREAAEEYFAKNVSMSHIYNLNLKFLISVDGRTPIEHTISNN